MYNKPGLEPYSIHNLTDLRHFCQFINLRVNLSHVSNATAPENVKNAAAVVTMMMRATRAVSAS